MIKKIIIIVLLLFTTVIFLVGIDQWCYHIIKSRKSRLKSTFSAGTPINDVIAHLEANREDLHLNYWKFGNGMSNFFVFIDAPFSITALDKEYDNAWILSAKVDPKTGVMKTELR